MTPTLAVQFSVAANGRKIIVDEDVLITGFTVSASNTRAVLSKDQSTTIASAITAPADTTDENILAIAGGFQVMPMRVPVPSGTPLFVSISAAGSAVIYFEPFPVQ